MEKLEEFLLGLGIEKAKVDDFISEKPTLTMDNMKENVFNQAKEVLKNDKDFISPIEEAMRSKTLSAKENKIMKAFGLTKEELKDKVPEKDFDALIDYASEKIKAPAAVEGTEELKTMIQELNASILIKDTAITKYDQETIPNMRKEVDNEISAFKLENKQVKVTSDILLTSDNRDGIHKLVMMDMNKNYDFRLDAQGEVEVLQKGSTELNVFQDNVKQGFKDLYTKETEKSGFLKKSNGADDPKPTEVVIKPREDESLDHLSPAQKAHYLAAKKAIGE